MANEVPQWYPWAVLLGGFALAMMIASNDKKKSRRQNG